MTISCAGGELSLAVAAGTLRHQASLRYDEARVAAASHKLVDVLARGARARTLSRAGLADLRTLGEELYRALIPPPIRDELAEIEGRPLLLEMDERLVAVPWELVYDGNAFLCRRFDLGRAVVTQLARRAAPARAPGRPKKMLVLCSDPHGDLPAASEEGDAIVSVLEAHRGVSVRMANGKGVAEVRAWLKDYDLLHFAGHAEYLRADPAASGWQLADGKLTAGDIVELAGGRAMPLVVFSNACSSSHESGWSGDDPGRVFGLANAFLLAGVRYYLGTQWEIVDAQSRIFARAFYTELGRGRGIGAAVRRAREAVIVAEGEAGLGWASYVLYGDPTYTPLDAADAPASSPGLPTPADLRDRESVRGIVKRLRRPPDPPPVRRIPWLLIMTTALLLALAATVAVLVLR